LLVEPAGPVEAERVMIKLLPGAGLTGWVVGYRTAGFVLDFAFPALRVAVEVDGLGLALGRRAVSR